MRPGKLIHIGRITTAFVLASSALAAPVSLRGTEPSEVLVRRGIAADGLGMAGYKINGIGYLPGKTEDQMKQIWQQGKGWVVGQKEYAVRAMSHAYTDTKGWVNTQQKRVVDGFKAGQQSAKDTWDTMGQKFNQAKKGVYRGIGSQFQRGANYFYGKVNGPPPSSLRREQLSPQTQTGSPSPRPDPASRPSPSTKADSDSWALVKADPYSSPPSPHSEPSTWALARTW